MQSTRRNFIKKAATTAAIGVAILKDDAIQRIQAAVTNAGSTPPNDLATNEDFWFQVQQAYDVDRSIINLNNGGVSPAPRTVLDAMRRHIEFTNQLPPRHLWNVLDPQLEPVRERLARTFGCDAEEMAIVRNTSEALETCLFGLDFKRGDEVLATSHDYPRMLNTLRQREKREGIVLKTFNFPTPPKSPDELVSLYKQNITDKTRAILVCHITNLTGQIFPIKAITRLGRERGIPVIVDGAHAFAHFPFKRDDLDCDYYGTSLHKWTSAPIGTGFLYVRKSKIKDLWPMMAAPKERIDNIRKFEEIGTHPTAPYLAIAEALTLYESIGVERKAARLRYLRDRWMKRLDGRTGIVLYTSFDPKQSCCLATVGIEGINPGELTTHLFKKHKILVTPIVHEHISGIRVTPNTYTTVRGVDRFAEAMEKIALHGLPS
jgi:selenocysteine lyase/cysteine desulfurase